MSYKLHTVIHTINGTVFETYASSSEELLVNKLPKDIIRVSECKSLIHYGSHKEFVGNSKHCFYYNAINTI